MPEISPKNMIHATRDISTVFKNKELATIGSAKVDCIVHEGHMPDFPDRIKITIKRPYDLSIFATKLTFQQELLDKVIGFFTCQPTYKIALETVITSNNFINMQIPFQINKKPFIAEYTGRRTGPYPWRISLYDAEMNLLGGMTGRNFDADKISQVKKYEAMANGI